MSIYNGIMMVGGELDGKGIEASQSGLSVALLCCELRTLEYKSEESWLEFFFQSREAERTT